MINRHSKSDSIANALIARYAAISIPRRMQVEVEVANSTTNHMYNVEGGPLPGRRTELPRADDSRRGGKVSTI